MTPLFIAWLLLVGALFGVMATLAYQWWGDRRPRVELDDYTARLRALGRGSNTAPSYNLPPDADAPSAMPNYGHDVCPGCGNDLAVFPNHEKNCSVVTDDEYLMEHLRKANREGWL